MPDFLRASALLGWAEHASAQGLQTPALLKQADLPGDVLDHPERIISFRRFSTLLQLSAQHSGNPFFGLELGLRQGAQMLGPLLYLMRNAQTLGDALAGLNSYYHLHTGSGQIALQVEGTLAHVRYLLNADALPPHAHEQAIEQIAGVGLQLMRTLLGAAWQARAIRFRHAPLGSLSSYKRLLGCTPQFNADADALSFDATWLQLPLHQADQALHALIQQHLELLDQWPLDEVPERLRQVLRDLLPTGMATLDHAARYLAISPRSLQRYLANTGHTFQDLLDQTRKEAAARYLSNSQLSVLQLAELLGYTDASAFSRAFRRWYACSPRDWRQRHAGAAPNPRLRDRRRLHRA